MILVRAETNPDDVHGMIAASGILTARGGATSHAAVVARGMGKPCVAGAESLQGRLPQARSMHGRAASWSTRATMISIDGTTGEVFAGAHPDHRRQLRRRDRTWSRCWAGPTRCASWGSGPTPTTRATPQRAVEFGAEGIGLCRTEHMFFEEERLPIVRRMILAAAEATAAKARRDAGASLSTDDAATVTTFDDALASSNAADR